MPYYEVKGEVQIIAKVVTFIDAENEDEAGEEAKDEWELHVSTSDMEDIDVQNVEILEVNLDKTMN